MFQKTIILPDYLDGKSGKRSACRGVVIDEDGYVPMVLDSYMGYYKLPGGGMEGDEDRIESFKREILEEAGCEINDIKEVGIVIEKNKNWEQINYCFVGKIILKGENHFTQKEIDRGFKLVWVKLDEALGLVENEQPRTKGGLFMKERESFILGEIINLKLL